MRGSLLVQAVLFGFFVLLAGAFVVVDVISGELTFSVVLVEPFALMSICWSLILSGLGKRRGGRVARGYVAIAIALLVLTLLSWVLAIYNDSRSRYFIGVGAILVFGALIAGASTVVANHRGLLGLPKKARAR